MHRTPISVWWSGLCWIAGTLALLPVTAADLGATHTAWQTMLEKRSQWWSFQPLKASAIPGTPSGDDTIHPVDRFIQERLRKAGLEPAPEADRATLLRRLTFILTGLPPTPDETTAFVNDPDPGAYERVVDRLLDSPRYGERWARHWMDLVRYCESHGSQ